MKSFFSIFYEARYERLCIWGVKRGIKQGVILG
jgi:hypothetical protein